MQASDVERAATLAESLLLCDQDRRALGVEKGDVREVELNPCGDRVQGVTEQRGSREIEFAHTAQPAAVKPHSLVDDLE